MWAESYARLAGPATSSSAPTTSTAAMIFIYVLRARVRGQFLLWELVFE